MESSKKPRMYPVVGRGQQQLPPRTLERELPDRVLLDEIAAAKGHPDRATWLRKLRTEAKRRKLPT